MPKRRVECAWSSVSAESRRQWQSRGVELRQFRNERSIQERQAASERAAGTGAEGAAWPDAQARPRPLTLSASPVAAPIHMHGATGESIGPMSHSKHQVRAQGAGEHSGPITNKRASGSQGSRVPGNRARHCGTRRQAPFSAPDHLSRPGQAAPHDVARTPSSGAEPAAGGREPNSRSEQSHLHAPPQYTHRQPPPAPRPAARRESHAGTSRSLNRRRARRRGWAAGDWRTNMIFLGPARQMKDDRRQMAKAQMARALKSSVHLSSVICHIPFAVRASVGKCGCADDVRTIPLFVWSRFHADQPGRCPARRDR